MNRSYVDNRASNLHAPPVANVGFWSAIIVVVFNIISSILMIISWATTPFAEWTGIEAFAESFATFQMVSMLPGIIVVIAFVPLMAGVHYRAEPEKRIYSGTGLAFAAICATILGFQYYSQLTSIRQSLLSGATEGLSLFVVGNTDSLWWSIETLGYGFMGLATLFAAPVFPRSIPGRRIRVLFIFNGFLSIAGLIVYPLGVGTYAILVGLVAWVVVFPLAIVLVAIDFRRRPH